jgi:MFS family permease
MIYVTEKLSLPLSVTTSLNTINAVAGIASVFVAGALVDRLGRKWAMVFSLGLTGLVYLLQGQANSYLAFALIMGFSGAVNPIYRVSADSMMADLLPKEKRVGGYSLMRMSNNIGISIGPAIGGFINSGSYSLAFYLAAGGMMIYSLLILLFARETLPARQPGEDTAEDRSRGYGKVLRDRSYLSFIGLFTLVQFCAAMVWILLSVYAKHQYGVNESLYGWIPTTNAIMVVVLQLAVTTVTRRFRALSVMAVGALFYALATGSIGFGQGFLAFELSMVIMTIGELVIMPTASTYAANHAPANMRGRYMSFFSLSWGAASGIAPVFGSRLGELFGPQATWFGGALVGLLSVAGFLFLARRERKRDQPSR